MYDRLISDSKFYYLRILSCVTDLFSLFPLAFHLLQFPLEKRFGSYQYLPDVLSVI